MQYLVVLFGIFGLEKKIKTITGVIESGLFMGYNIEVMSN